MVRRGSTTAAYALSMLHSNRNFFNSVPQTVGPDSVSFSPATHRDAPPEAQSPLKDHPPVLNFGKDQVHLSAQARFMPPSTQPKNYGTRGEVRQAFGTGKLAKLANSYFEQQQMADDEHYRIDHPLA